MTARRGSEARPVTETQDKPYRVEVDKGGCERCSHGQMWTIVGPDGYAFGESWGDREFVEDLVEYLNDAYEAGSRRYENAQCITCAKDLCEQDSGVLPVTEPRPDAVPEDEQQAPLELFTELEIALYGKAGNTWEQGKMERVMAVLRKAALRAVEPRQQDEALMNRAMANALVASAARDVLIRRGCADGDCCEPERARTKALDALGRALACLDGTAARAEAAPPRADTPFKVWTFWCDTHALLCRADEGCPKCAARREGEIFNV